MNGLFSYNALRVNDLIISSYINFNAIIRYHRELWLICGYVPLETYVKR